MVQSIAALAVKAGVMLRGCDGQSQWVFLDSCATHDDELIKGSPIRQLSPANGCVPRQAFGLKCFAGKGIGGVALRCYQRGECIWQEEPLMQWDAEANTRAALMAHVQKLSTTDRQTFWELCHNTQLYGHTKTVYGVCRSNAFPTESAMESGKSTATASRGGAVYRGFSRLNHACTPNAHGAFNGRLGQQTMYTLRDIERGEELTVDYLGSVGIQRAERRMRLRQRFGFDCSCSACSMTGVPFAESEARQKHIGELAVDIMSTGRAERHADRERLAAGTLVRRSRPHPLGDIAACSPCVHYYDTKTMRLLLERLQLLWEEGLGSSSWDTLWTASTYCAFIGDREGARKWAAEAAESARMALGQDSAEYVKYSAAAQLPGRPTS